MRILKRKMTIETDMNLHSTTKIYSINDRGCLTIRMGEDASDDILILFDSYETQRLRTFLSSQSR